MPPEPSTQMAASAGTVPGAWSRDALTADPATRPAPVVSPAEPAPRPVPEGERPGRLARVPRRGRRVKRIVRRVELWSVLKLALIFFLCMYVVGLLTVAVLWGFANSAGLVDNFESFANEVGWENWQFDGEEMFRQAAVIGGVLVVAATLMTVLATALLNVISELTGGIRLVVIEEDVTAAQPPVIAPVEGRRSRRSRRD
jgi:Transmembrane domain of unknown function (DUF3566)